MQDKPFGVNLTILPALIPADALPKNAREKSMILFSWHFLWTQDYDAYARVLAEEKVGMYVGDRLEAVVVRLLKVTLVELAAGSPKKYTPMWKADASSAWRQWSQCWNCANAWIFAFILCRRNRGRNLLHGDISECVECIALNCWGWCQGFAQVCNHPACTEGGPPADQKDCHALYCVMMAFGNIVAYHGNIFALPKYTHKMKDPQHWPGPGSRSRHHRDCRLRRCNIVQPRHDALGGSCW